MPDSSKTQQQLQQPYFTHPAQLPIVPGPAAALPAGRSFESLPDPTAGFLLHAQQQHQPRAAVLASPHSLDAALAKVGKKDAIHPQGPLADGPTSSGPVFPAHLLATMALSGQYSAAHAALLSGHPHPGAPSAAPSAAVAGQQPQHHHHPQPQHHYLQYQNSPQRGGGQHGFFQEMRLRFSMQRPESPMRNFILEGKSSDFF